MIVTFFMSKEGAAPCERTGHGNIQNLEKEVTRVSFFQGIVIVLT